MSGPDKKHIDRKKIDARNRTRERIDNLLITGDEDAYVQLIKAAKPDVTPESLRNLIEQFRQLRSQRN